MENTLKVMSVFDSHWSVTAAIQVDDT